MSAALVRLQDVLLKAPLKIDYLYSGLLENTSRQRFYIDTRNKFAMILDCWVPEIQADVSPNLQIWNMPQLQRYHATRERLFEPMDKKRELFKGILLFPGTVFILIPAIILQVSGPIRWFCGKTFPESVIVVAVTFFLACVGSSVALWTVMLFYNLGNGTPVPWAPPKHLVINGPYAYVRNPMIMAALAILLAETLLFGSIGILIWAGVLWGLNTLYITLIEEPGLKHRFGDEYDEYSKNVARWVPRMAPWFPMRSPDRL